MKRNALRIVCNPGTDRISYYFRNEQGEWLVLSGSSPLSRQFYTKTTLEKRCKEIVEKADEIYNRKNKGLDIYYEGPSKGYKYLDGAIKCYLRGRDVVCKQRMTRIAVVGKEKTGKTYLIEGIEDFQKEKYKRTEKTGYKEYLDEKNNVCWCEIKGMGLGLDPVGKTLSTIKNMMANDLSVIIYCISGTTGRIEETERSFLTRLKNEFPGFMVLTVVTMCFKDDTRAVCDEIEKIIDHIEVFPVLAKEYRGSSRYIVKPFGIDVLYTYIFEGKKVPRKYHSEMILQETKQNKRGLLNSFSRPKEEKNNSQNNSFEKRITKESFTQKSNAGNIKPDNVFINIPKRRKIAVVGKKATGKTVLIEGIEKFKGVKFRRSDNDGKYCLYEDEKNQTEWYEVKGIDLGIDKIEDAYRTVKQLVFEGVSSIAYCISAGSGRIEDIEKDLIRQIADDFPNVKVTIILTMCFKEDIQEIINDVQSISDRVKVIQTLAREYPTRIINPQTGQPSIIEPFGLSEVSEL